MELSKVFLPEPCQCSGRLSGAIWDVLSWGSFLSITVSLAHPHWPLLLGFIPSAKPALFLFPCPSILKRLTQTQKTLRSFDVCQLPLYESSQRTGDITCGTQLPSPARKSSHVLGWSTFPVRFVFNLVCRQQIPSQKGPAPPSVPSWNSEQRKRLSLQPIPQMASQPVPQYYTF